MNPSVRTVSFCGSIDDTVRNALLAALPARGISIVPWASNIDLLILGADAPSHWKYARARERNWAVLDAAALYAQLFGSSGATSALASLWVDTYAPRTAADIVGHSAQKTELAAWLRAWRGTAPPQPRSVLITGPPGIGKTTTVHCIAAECGFDIVECNASEERSAASIRSRFETAAVSASYGHRPSVLIMDEVDGMSSGDRGGIGELARILKTSTLPIICIANDRGTPKLRPLTAACLDMRFHRPTKTQIAKWLLQTVLAKERLHISAAELEALCERSGNDIRAILNSLQFSSRVRSSGGNGATAAGEKDALLRVDAFSATGKLFGGARSGGTLADRVQLAFVDHSIVPLMVAEAYIAAAQKSLEGIHRCVIAAQHIEHYDILDQRIHRTQTWGLLPDAMHAVVSAAAAADGPAPFQIFPQWLGKQSKRLKHRRWIRALCSRTRWSQEEALDAAPVLRTRLFARGRSATEIVDDLQSLRLTRDDMLETLVDLAWSDDPGCVAALDTKTKSAISREWKKRVADGGIVEESAAPCGEEDVVDVDAGDDVDDWAEA